MIHWDTMAQPIRTAKEYGAPFCHKTSQNLSKQAFLKLA